MQYIANSISGIKGFNQDYWLEFSSPFYSCFIIGDGVGGSESGDFAANFCCDFVATNLRPRINSIQFFEDSKVVLSVLQNAILNANSALINECENKNIRAFTTFTLLLITSNKYYWGHVGDSRITIFGTSVPKLITKDHNRNFEMFMEKKISYKQYLNLPGKNILDKALGMKDLNNIDLGCDNFDASFVFLMTTDGAHNVLDYAELNEFVLKNNFPTKEKFEEFFKTERFKDDATYLLIKK